MSMHVRTQVQETKKKIKDANKKFPSAHDTILYLRVCELLFFDLTKITPNFYTLKVRPCARWPFYIITSHWRPMEDMPINREKKEGNTTMKTSFFHTFVFFFHLTKGGRADWGLLDCGWV